MSAETARPLARSQRVGAVLAVLFAAAPAGGADAPKAAAGQWVPSQAQASAYGAKGGRCPSTGPMREVLEILEGNAKTQHREPAKSDPALCAVAEAFMRWDEKSGPPRPAVLAFVSRWFGIPAPVLPPSIATFDTEDNGVMAQSIAQAVAQSALNAAHPRIGVVSQRVRRGTTKVAVVLVDDPIEIAPPFPKRLELGQKATLSGKLLSGVKNPKVQVSDATGKLSTPEQPPGDAFQAEIACGDKPGRIYVEIRAELEGRTGTVANFPVGCGTDLPASVAIAPEPWPADPAQAAKKIADLVNAERVGAGLPELKWDPTVAQVAAGVSQELGVDPTARIDVGERLRKEGIASQVVLQSAATDRSFERVHDRLVSSPVNRANIMSPEVTSLGIGGATHAGPDGKPLVTVTELYTKELPPADPAKVRADLKAAIAQKRKDARATPLKDEPMLDDAAQKYAQALAAAGGNLTKEQEAQLVAPLQKTMRTLSILSGAKPDPLDFAEEPKITAVAKSVGVGVAPGKHPVLGRNAVYVVVMVGTTRAEAAEPVTAPGKAKAKKKPAR